MAGGSSSPCRHAGMFITIKLVLVPVSGTGAAIWGTTAGGGTVIWIMSPVLMMKSAGTSLPSCHGVARDCTEIEAEQVTGRLAGAQSVEVALLGLGPRQADRDDPIERGGRDHDHPVDVAHDPVAGLDEHIAHPDRAIDGPAPHLRCARQRDPRTEHREPVGGQRRNV